MQLIELKNVYKRYSNGVTALNDVNLTISKCEFVFVIGQTASGKSTLIKLLYRQEKPQNKKDSSDIATSQPTLQKQETTPQHKNKQSQK